MCAKDYTDRRHIQIMSVSGRELVLEIQGKAKTRCVLKRHLSPRTVGILLRNLPIEGHIHQMGASIMYIETPLDSGTERPRDTFKRGDIAFLSSSGSVCFFLDDTILPKTMTTIGHLDDVKILHDTRSGDLLRIYAAD